MEGKLKEADQLIQEFKDLLLSQQEYRNAANNKSAYAKEKLEASITKEANVRRRLSLYEDKYKL